MAKKCKFNDCNKKMTPAEQLIGKCKCGKTFCSKHRHNHDCTFDYKGLVDKEKIIEENKCVASKMSGEKI